MRIIVSATLVCAALAVGCAALSGRGGQLGVGNTQARFDGVPAVGAFATITPQQVAGTGNATASVGGITGLNLESAMPLGVVVVVCLTVIVLAANGISDNRTTRESNRNTAAALADANGLIRYMLELSHQREMARIAGDANTNLEPECPAT